MTNHVMVVGDTKVKDYRTHTSVHFPLLRDQAVPLMLQSHSSFPHCEGVGLQHQIPVGQQWIGTLHPITPLYCIEKGTLRDKRGMPVSVALSRGIPSPLWRTSHLSATALRYGALITILLWLAQHSALKDECLLEVRTGDEHKACFSWLKPVEHTEDQGI